MNDRNRRQFLADVGRGMLIAGVGSGLAAELGLAPLGAADGSDRLTFGPLEPLVGLMQDTDPDKLLPLLVERIRNGTELRKLVAAAALSNAREFGGEDYVGFHTMMALAPAFQMSREMPAERQALPVLKVLYRNSKRIQEKGGPKVEVLHPVAPATNGKPTGTTILEAVRRKDASAAEAQFAAIAKGTPEEALNELLAVVEDGLEVHRTVMPHRAWVLLDIVGREHAHTLLRQSVRYCVHNESDRYSKNFSEIRGLLPKLLERHKLLDRPLGKKTADDAWVERMSETVFKSSPADAAEAAAAALAEGFSPETIAEAVSLAANQLVLRDPGRPQSWASPGKPAGSVHGDSTGVHSCDAVNAWRNMARVSNPRNAAACVILSAYMVPRDRGHGAGDYLKIAPRPWAEHLEAVKSKEPAALLREAEEAIRANDQARACAVVARYGELGHPERPVFDLLLRYAVSEEGALHAEKYYRTVSEEFATTRPRFRWRQLVALARVTASEFGYPAAGYAEMCKLLRL